jgi:hypothetical protein
LFIKEFCISSRASRLSELYHSIRHLKYNFYVMCSEKVILFISFFNRKACVIVMCHIFLDFKTEQVKSQLNDNNAAPDILNLCLADNHWLMEVCFFISLENVFILLFELKNIYL